MLNITITKVVYVCMCACVCVYVCVCVRVHARVRTVYMDLYGEYEVFWNEYSIIRKYSSYILLSVINGELNRESSNRYTYGVTNVLP